MRLSFVFIQSFSKCIVVNVPIPYIHIGLYELIVIPNIRINNPFMVNESVQGHL